MRVQQVRGDSVLNAKGATLGMSAFALAASPGSSSWANLAIIGGAVACYVFLVLLPFYYRQKGVAGQPDPRASLLRTAAVILLLVGVFLTVFAMAIRQSYGGGAASLLGLEAVVYFAVATAVILLARRRPGKAAG